MKSSLPCMCEWCWGERRCPGGGGDLLVLNCQFHRLSRCVRGWKGLCDAVARHRGTNTIVTGCGKL